MDDCEALLRIARGVGRERLGWQGACDPRRPPSASPSRKRSELRRHRPPRDRARPARALARLLARRPRRSRIAPRGGESFEDVFFRVFLNESSRSSGSAGRRSCSTGRSRWRAGAREAGRSAGGRAGGALRLRARARERLLRAHRCGRAAPALRARPGREGAALRRALSDRPGLPGRARARPAGKRGHGARLRPARDAGDRRGSDRRRAVGTGGRDRTRDEAVHRPRGTTR